MPNYQLSIIYKLCCKDPTITYRYVGSTTNFTRRKCDHKAVCNNPNDKDYNGYKYKIIRDNGGFKNWDMIQIEVVNVNNKRELELKQREYIEILKPSLNKHIVIRTDEERKEKHREYIKKYREQNKDKIKEYGKKYREENKDKNYEYEKRYSESLKIRREQY